MKNSEYAGIEVLDNLDPSAEVKKDEWPGQYYTKELCTLEAVPAQPRSYFNYGAYGRDVRPEIGTTVSQTMGL